EQRHAEGALLESATKRGGRVDLSFEPLDLRLHVPFTISRGTQTVANNLRVTLTAGGDTGLGEAAPAEHYGESDGSVHAFLERLQPLLAEHDSLPISVLHEL